MDCSIAPSTTCRYTDLTTTSTTLPYTSRNKTLQYAFLAKQETVPFARIVSFFK